MKYFILLLLVLFFVMNSSSALSMTNIKKENYEYKVRTNSHIHMNKAASLLHNMKKKTEELYNFIQRNNYNTPEFKRLLSKQDVKFEEIQPHYEGEAAYSINKGEKIGICLYNKNKFMLDENTMFFVVLHELAHIMSTKYAHDDEFWNNFAKIIKVAMDAGLYTYQDYSKQEENFCGHDITNNPYNYVK